MDRYLHERAYAEWEEQRRENAECDALIERLQQRSERLDTTPSESVMSDADSAAWNEWATAIARREANYVAEVLSRIIGEATGELERKQNDDWHSAFDALEARVADLEARLDEIQGVGKSAPLLMLKGGRNNAA
jgi:hypothetical protein